MNKLVMVVVVIVPCAAFAQPAPAPAPVPAQADDPTHGPGFVNLDRMDATSQVGIDASYSYFDTDPGQSVTPVRVDLHGQYVDPVSGVGGYAQMPFTYYSASQTGGSSDSATGVGDLEAGGIYVPHLTTPGVGLVLHAGLTLPTASTANNSLTGGTVANVLGLDARLTDFYQAIPKGTSLRIGVSPLLRSGQLFARADLGIDINLSDDSSSNNGSTEDAFIRFNAAAGVDLGQVALSVESVNVYDTKANSGDFGSSWIDTGAVAARFRAGQTQPYASVVFPLDHDSHNLLLKFDAALTVGVVALLQ